MSKFIYKLQPLLNVKTQLEDNLKNQLAGAAGSLETEKGRMLELEEHQETCTGNVRQEARNGIPVARLKEYGAYLSVLRGRVADQKENVTKAQNRVDTYREQLVQASQQKEMLVKLKEGRYEEYRKLQLRQEQQHNDEITSYKLNTSMAGE